MYFPDAPWRMSLSSLPGFILLLISHHFQIVNAERFKVTGPNQPVVAFLDEDAVLPCCFSPALSAEHMQVRWFRTGFDSVVHLYEDGKDQIWKQIPEYQGRTEQLRSHISNGNVSLRIRNITLYDEGIYTCFIRIDPYYEEATVELKVVGLGSPLSISVNDYRDRGIRVMCESAGWYPKPEVTWKQESGHSLTSLSETETQEHNGLFNVRTHLLMRTNQYGKISCRIRNTVVNQERQSVIFIADAFYQRVSRWKVSVSILLVSVLILCGFLVMLVVYHLKKERQVKAKLSANVERLTAKLEWIKRCSYAVDVTLDRETAHPDLLLSEDLKSVQWRKRNQNVPDNPVRFGTDSCLLGCEGFTSGRHYWEVEVGDADFWRLGVCKDSVKRKGHITLSPEKGYWTIQRWHRDRYSALITPKKTQLFPRETPQAVGIFLDCEAGNVSFYNADNNSHLYTFTNSFTEKFQPFFWTFSENVPLRIRPVSAWECEN
ncbi:butyrophilin subfamily 1 member A1 [Microcaecilia unicolor]|uniref:Butyrophilin subfamily 1 member A1-like n=1 Tax=Microcaecilia unicolor TaxID=1415580 RepID=A0A6P7XSJ6_9AMPH|nr:butyrophilin subfamily 1 member A1-like [Microcaecilia unicolor]